MVRSSIVCILALAACVHASDPTSAGLHPLAFIHEPTHHNPASIPASVGWAIVDIDEVNEADQVIIVKQFMQITWEDVRWKKALEWQCQQPGNDAWTNLTCSMPEESRTWAWFEFLINRTADRYPAFLKKARATANLLGANHPPSGPDPWVPLAEKMLPKAGDNLAGVTSVTPYVFPVGLTELTAFWPDEGRTTFHTTFKYTHFPFDVQNFTMCIDLVYHAMPSEVLTFRVSPGKVQPFSELSSVLINKYEPSSFSPRVSKATVEAFASKGFGVLSVTREIRQRGVASQMCTNIELKRFEANFHFRFLLPLNFLLFTSFAGFWLPIGQAMPRIATGFVSFLSLAVFRTMAYSMVPRPNYDFMWIDALMLSVTEIMFLAVMANIVSQVVNDYYCVSACKYADQLLRVAFPLVSLFTQVLLFALGGEHANPKHVFFVVQIELALAILIVTILQYRFLKDLPHRLLYDYVVKMTNSQSLLGADVKVDHWEMGQIFSLMDKNFDGLISASHILQTIEEHGLEMNCDEERDDFKVAILRVCEIAKAKHNIDDRDREEPMIGYDGFVAHFKDFFSKKAVRKRLSRCRSDSMLRQTVITKVAPVNLGTVDGSAVPQDSGFTHLEASPCSIPPRVKVVPTRRA